MEDKALPQTLGSMILDRFIRKNPLAAGMRLVLEQLFVAEQINAVFERNRCQQYTRQILFTTIIEVMLAVVTRRAATVNAALRKRMDTIGASITAFYDKLNGSEPPVAEALVDHSASQGRKLLTAMGGLRKELLPGWRLRILDGNHLAATQRRLEALWRVSAGPLPGLALVIFDMAAMLMSDVILCEDGHAQERSLTDRILALVAAGDCWIADRNFCTHSILFGILRSNAAFVIRQHANMLGKLVGVRFARGRCATGTLFEQQMKLTFEGEARTIRRVTIVLDKLTRDGDREMHVLTSLPATVSAAHVVALYRDRWTIEAAFGDLSRWLDAEIAPLGYPRAALLGFCVGIMAYNAISTLLGALRATHGEEVVRDQVSGYYIAEFGRDAVGMVDDVTEVEDWEPWRKLSLLAAAALLKAVAARIDLRMIRKSKRGPKKPVPARTRFKNKPHVSTKKLLDGTMEEDS